MSQFQKTTSCKTIIPCDDCERCKMFKDICSDPRSAVTWEEYKSDLIDNHLMLQYQKIKETEDLDRRRELLGLKVKKNKKHHFVTISLDPSKTPNIDSINSGLTYKYLHDSIFTYEFTGSEGQFHPHIHMLVEAYPDGKIIPKSTILRDFARYFKLKNNFIDIKSEPWAYNTRRAYILGEKKTLKELQVQEDAVYREKNHIDPYYTI